MERVLYIGTLWNMHDLGDGQVLIARPDTDKTLIVNKEDCRSLLKMHDIPEEVTKHVEEFFTNKEHHLGKYTIEEIIRGSEHPDDDYLYEVIAKDKTTRTYACWTCWNESTQSLNYGHYNLGSINDAIDICVEYYNKMRFTMQDDLLQKESKAMSKFLTQKLHVRG